VNLNLTEEQKELLKMLVEVYDSGCKGPFALALSHATPPQLSYVGHPAVALSNVAVLDFQQLTNEGMIVFDNPTRNLYTGKPTAKGIDLAHQLFRNPEDPHGKWVWAQKQPTGYTGNRMSKSPSHLAQEQQQRFTRDNDISEVKVKSGDDPWFMKGTEGTGEYIVVLRTHLGRVGYRLLSGFARIRVEPEPPGHALLTEILTRDRGWKQPGDQAQDRFSVEVKMAELPDALNLAIEALDPRGSGAEVNPDVFRSVPVWVRQIVDRAVHYDPETADERSRFDRRPGRGGIPSAFIAYSHNDHLLKDELLKHLSPLRREGLVRVWHDRDIRVGTHWNNQIDQYLNQCELILLLISADFINSDYGYGVEMSRALKRHERGDARVFPVILRPCDWTCLPIGKLQVLPRNGRAVIAWSRPDDAYTEIAQELRTALTLGREEQPHELEAQHNRPPVVVPEVERNQYTASVANHADIDDLSIELYDHPPYGLAVRLHNGALTPVENCKVLLTRLDRYITSKHNDFTRNPCEPITVLYVQRVNGQDPSEGFTFAVTDVNCTSIRFNSAIPEFRRSALPEMIRGTWLLEFTVKQKDLTLKKEEFFITWAPGSRPQLTTDPRLGLS
jgi:hypothetical protein